MLLMPLETLATNLSLRKQPKFSRQTHSSRCGWPHCWRSACYLSFSLLSVFQFRVFGRHRAIVADVDGSTCQNRLHFSHNITLGSVCPCLAHEQPKLHSPECNFVRCSYLCGVLRRWYFPFARSHCTVPVRDSSMLSLA